MLQLTIYRSLTDFLKHLTDFMLKKNGLGESIRTSILRMTYCVFIFHHPGVYPYVYLKHYLQNLSFLDIIREKKK